MATNAYIAAGGAPGHVVVFSRDAASGELLFRQHLERGTDDPLGNEIQGIGNAASIIVSPDDSRVYVAGQSDDSIAVFNRNLGDNGRLSLSQPGGQHAWGVCRAFSRRPAWRSRQRVSSSMRLVGTAIQWRFSLVKSNGDLDFVQHLQAGSGDVEGLEEPLRVTVSPDGELVYVVSASDGTEAEPGTLTVMRRETGASDPAFGQLSYEEVKRNNLGGCDRTLGRQWRLRSVRTTRISTWPPGLTRRSRFLPAICWHRSIRSSRARHMSSRNGTTAR